MMRRAAKLVAICIALACGGCISRTLPIPPPGATAAASDCAASELCGDGGVTVTVTGMAEAGALVLVRDVDRSFPDGRPMTASSFAALAASSADGGVVDGGVSQQGAYVVTLAPVPDGAGGVLAAHRGDHLEVTQFVRLDNGDWQQSLADEIVVN